MRRYLLFVLAAVLFLSGCTSFSQLKQEKFCEEIKGMVNMEFQMYGIFMLPAASISNMHYCEFMLGPSKAFEVLYSDEPDPELAFVKSLSSVKSNAVLNGFQVDKTESFGNSSIKTFYVVFKNQKTNGRKTVSGAFDSHSSVIASAAYVFGYPNPFVEPTLLTKIAVRSLQISDS